LGWPKNIAAAGALVALIKEASDDILFIKATNNHTKQQIIPIVKDKAIATPKKVATPLPPLNLSQTGKQWPAKALKAEI
jgi:hypothetical protein